MFRLLVVARERDEDETARGLTLAWQIANLSRSKKLPDLRNLLARIRRRPQTVGEQRAMVQILSDQYGIPLRRQRTKVKRG